MTCGVAGLVRIKEWVNTSAESWCNCLDRGNCSLEDRSPREHIVYIDISVFTEKLNMHPQWMYSIQSLITYVLPITEVREDFHN